ncbi:MAG: hypothetical protein ACKVVT_18685 [Dehalococcoidia bacterium]
MSAATILTVADASRHLWEALSHHQITLDLDAHDPLVQAISAYGQACRASDAATVAATSKHVWEELSRHRVTLDLGANDPVIKALSEYGDACRHEGPRSAAK